MSEKEGKILKIYEGSRAREEELYDLTWVNQVAWTLMVLFAGIIVWLAIALVNAENQRYALVSGKCGDPVFKGSFDQKCLSLVRSRDHWWEHLWYGVTHVKPEMPK
ncbi:MAG TPA: hypothetical protein VF663_16315 [Telluria sp.]|jgi:hypothetical protein